ncbi:MAG: hypothetical protein H7338_02140 [Candidatus Sericytochromatia bacterium]|nr:hypothetical protein [Candidatus Sericytochromatia bacterium]
MNRVNRIITVLVLLLFFAAAGQSGSHVLCLEDNGSVQIESLIACTAGGSQTIVQTPAEATNGPQTLSVAVSDCGACTDIPLLADGTASQGDAVGEPDPSNTAHHPALAYPPIPTWPATAAALRFQRLTAPAVTEGRTVTLRETVLLLC